MLLRDSLESCPSTGSADAASLRIRTTLHFHCAYQVCHLPTRIYVRRLGPCFKTGRLKPLRQNLKRAGARQQLVPTLTAAMLRIPALSPVQPPPHAAERALPVLRPPQSNLRSTCTAGFSAQAPTFLSAGHPLVKPILTCPFGKRDLTLRCATTAYGALPVSNASLLTVSSSLNSLFKVLFIFPSRYLFAIGLSPLFSFR